MKTWIITAIVIGILAVAAFGVVSFAKADSQSGNALAPKASSTPSCGATSGCSAGCSHSGSSGQCGCGASCGCSGANGCGCKTAK